MIVKYPHSTIPSLMSCEYKWNEMVEEGKFESFILIDVLAPINMRKRGQNPLTKEDPFPCMAKSKRKSFNGSLLTERQKIQYCKDAEEGAYIKIVEKKTEGAE